MYISKVMEIIFNTYISKVIEIVYNVHFKSYRDCLEFLILKDLENGDGWHIYIP